MIAFTMKTIIRSKNTLTLLGIRSIYTVPPRHLSKSYWCNHKCTRKTTYTSADAYAMSSCKSIRHNKHVNAETISEYRLFVFKNICVLTQVVFLRESRCIILFIFWKSNIMNRSLWYAYSLLNRYKIRKLYDCKDSDIVNTSLEAH